MKMYGIVPIYFEQIKTFISFDSVGKKIDFLSANRKRSKIKLIVI